MGGLASIALITFRDSIEAGNLKSGADLQSHLALTPGAGNSALWNCLHQEAKAHSEINITAGGKQGQLELRSGAGNSASGILYPNISTLSKYGNSVFWNIRLEADRGSNSPLEQATVALAELKSRVEPLGGRSIRKSRAARGSKRGYAALHTHAHTNTAQA